MTKPTKWLCAQWRLRSAWASAQSDQSLRCPHEESLGPKLPIKRMPSLIRVFAVRMKKAWVLSYPLSAQRRLIRLDGCPGWSESSLGAQSLCWFWHVVAHMHAGHSVGLLSLSAASSSHIWAQSWENLSSGFATSYDSNRLAQLQRQARVLKLLI